MSTNDRAPIDFKSILTGVITSAIMSCATFAWFMGGLDNRVKSLESSSGKIDLVSDKLNLISQNLAVLSTDMTYVKENMKDIKANSNILGNDVRELRSTVDTMRKNEGR